MKVAQLLETRRRQWHDLELLCQDLERRRPRKMGGEKVSRFAALYRDACADLALADAYQLPPDTVQYLHQLVGRSHNQLYRSQMFNWSAWGDEILRRLPRRLLRDRALWLAFGIFWGVFFASMGVGFSSRSYCEKVVGEVALDQLQASFSEPIRGRSPELGGLMTGFYVIHNAGIGLRCFAAGLLLGIGGLFITVSNAVQLGAMFGYMFTTDERTNFLHFVTAHGPFELTAIVFSAAAGMRLGFSLVSTGGLKRVESLKRAAVSAAPTMGFAVTLFCLAALIEGFLSPSSAPYEIKLGVAIVSTCLMLLYVVGLGIDWSRLRGI